MAFSWRAVTQGQTEIIKKDFTNVKGACDIIADKIGISRYTWTVFPISDRDKMRFSQLQELRDALDYLDDNNTCSSENASDNTSDDGDDNTTVDSGENATDNADHDSTVDSNEHGTDNPGYDSTVDNNENTGVDTGQNTTVDTDEHTSDNAALNSTVDNDENTTVDVDQHGSFLSNYHYSYDGTDRPGYNSVET